MASAADHDGDSGDRKMEKAGMDVNRLLAASDKRREVAFGGVSAARSANVVDGREDAGNVADRRQEPADAAHLGNLNDAVRSEDKVIMASTAIDGVTAGTASTNVKCRRHPLAFQMGHGATGRRHLGRRQQDQGRNQRASSAAVTGSDKVYAGDQEADSTTSPNHFGKRPSSHHTKPAEAVAPSSAAAGDGRQENGGIDLYRLGLEAAVAMDDQTILSEVAKYVGAEAHQQQRLQRRPTRKKKTAAAPKAPVFSLRLTDEEAMEDVAAVSVVKDVNAEAASVSRNRKRRRD